jgi:hypothetical protein
MAHFDDGTVSVINSTPDTNIKNIPIRKGRKGPVAIAAGSCLSVADFDDGTTFVVYGNTSTNLKNINTSEPTVF